MWSGLRFKLHLNMYKMNMFQTRAQLFPFAIEPLWDRCANMNISFPIVLHFYSKSVFPTNCSLQLISSSFYKAYQRTLNRDHSFKYLRILVLFITFNIYKHINHLPFLYSCVHIKYFTVFLTENSCKIRHNDSRQFITSLLNVLIHVCI